MLDADQLSNADFLPRDRLITVVKLKRNGKYGFEKWKNLNVLENLRAR